MIPTEITQIARIASTPSVATTRKTQQMSLHRGLSRIPRSSTAVLVESIPKSPSRPEKWRDLVEVANVAICTCVTAIQTLRMVVIVWSDRRWWRTCKQLQIARASPGCQVRASCFKLRGFQVYLEWGHASPATGFSWRTTRRSCVTGAHAQPRWASDALGLLRCSSRRALRSQHEREHVKSCANV